LLLNAKRLTHQERHESQATKGDTAETREILAHHLECFGKLDLAGTMTDYADESRFFSHGGVLHGSDSIRKFYGTLFEEFEKPGMSFDLLQQEVDDDTAYIVWKAETADNSSKSAPTPSS
jgi:ketosteroid isomerase-like protein